MVGRWGLVVLALLLGPLGAVVAQTGQPSVRVVGNHAPPYRIVEHGVFRGIYIDAFREVARRAGFSVEFHEAPTARALLMLDSGEADVMLGPNRTPEREAFLVFTKATFPSEPKVFYSNLGGVVDNYHDLAGKTIAVVRSAVYFEPFDSDLGLIKEVAPDYESALRKVEAGRNDVVIAPELQGDYLVRSLGLKLVKAAYRVEGRPSHIALSRRSPVLALQGTIEATLEALMADGTWDRIVARYR